MKFEDYFPMYRRWLIDYAQQKLTPIVCDVAEETGLAFSRLSYGHQKTMWGSCSSDSAIRLNAKLLYLPFRFVRYVIIHELCHTEVFNHQPEFWSLVGQFQPDHLELRRLMRTADRYIPPILNQ